MSEWSAHWTTDAATPEGHQQASYSQLDNTKIQRALGACNGFEGVATDYGYALAGTVTGANTVAINSGDALVDGKVYINNASLNVNIPSSGGGTTRIDRIVLRADWAAFTVTVTRIEGTESAGTPTAPAITQTPGTTYDIMLYQALVNSSGTVTLTDERVMAAPLVAYRQGGSATNWDTEGTANYVPGKTIMQVGRAVLPPGAPYLTVVVFPVKFSYQPLVFLQYKGSLAAVAKVLDTYADSFTFEAFTIGGVFAANAVVSWFAMGPIA